MTRGLLIHRIRGGFMARRRDWCKLDEAWYSNKKVRRLLRDYGPVAGSYWCYMIARAYDASHHEDNPQGRFTTTMRDISDDLYDQHDRTELITAMQGRGLLRFRGEVVHGSDENVTFELVDFAGWQWPKGAPARRQAASRYQPEKSAISRDVSQLVTEPSQMVTQKREEGEETRYLTSSAVVRPPTPTSASRATTSVDAEAEARFVESVTNTLSELTTTRSEAAAVADALLWKASNIHPQAKRRFPLEQWEAAVTEFVAAVKSGRTPDGNPVPYIIGMVPTAGAKLEIRPDVIGSDVPDPDRDAARAAADAERRIAELYGSAS